MYEMESIIPLIIMLIVGSLFKGKRDKGPSEEEKTKPFMPRQERTERSDDPFKKLKEISKEMYREMQQEMQREAEPQQNRPRTSPPVAVPVRPVVQQPTPPVREVQREKVRSQREPLKERQTMRGQSTTGKTTVTRRQSINTANLLPKSEEDLIKGVIFSEIFGPPKSKR